MLTLSQANYLSFFNWVLITSAKASIFIIFLLGVKFVLRHKIRAGFQYVLWSVLIIGLVLPWTPNSPISVYNYLDFFHLQQKVASIIDRTIPSSSANLADQQSALELAAVGDGNSQKADVSAETLGPSEEKSNTWISFPFVYRLMSYIWLSGVLILTILTVIVNKRFSKNIGHALVTDQGLLSEFNKLKVDLKIKTEIPLLKSRQVNSPSLLGLSRPRLLLPIGIEERFSLEQLNHIFLHELIHFKRKDVWINCLTQLLIICHWFNPLIWYAFYRMREDQEISCDALATARIDAEHCSDYAYTLLKLAETYSAAPRLAGMASLCGSNSQIKKRLIMIKSREDHRSSAKWSLLGVVAIGVLALTSFASPQVMANPPLYEKEPEQAIGLPKEFSDISSGVIVEDISGENFKGKVMLIKDPTRIKLAVTKDIGVMGERVSELVKARGAIAGINAGGFYDPNGKGNGAFPDGLTVQNGKLVDNNVGEDEVNIVGFDDQGKLVLGKMRANQLEARHIREAVSFAPNLIVGGKSVILEDDGWGIAPRTGIGQRADGTVIFVVIDGRQPTWSIGATLSDLTKVFEDYHAVNAVNLDGGSSSEMVFQGKVQNKLPNVFGERYVSTAFVVTP
ncbi:exopolysaccharide biosynthesis protein [Desulfosporosinus meridiei DSM 13257]|uniref:Exopolysaccharide biosynthesis protein n=1 Tax=Desulfosporosinus meridiei (strain ATCC BAA-275 / DSM 13257 / KCTC 12902 / NCIMB 13706 / S10) TaxID=768704 RepID=J7IQ46_DESMD|nr:exopolysaccharide biosynthesis protein [Desulfosporosinus meridiei DSM 13257]